MELFELGIDEARSVLDKGEASPVDINFQSKADGFLPTMRQLDAFLVVTGHEISIGRHVGCRC